MYTLVYPTKILEFARLMEPTIGTQNDSQNLEAAKTLPVVAKAGRKFTGMKVQTICRCALGKIHRQKTPTTCG